MKKLLFGICFLSFSAVAAPAAEKAKAPALKGEEATILPEPDLECGDYWGQGNLRLNNQGEYVLTFNESSSSPSEVITLGGAIKEKHEKLGAKVAVEFYVPRPIKSNQQPYVFFQKFVPIVHEIDKDFVRRLAKKKCNDLARFRQ